MTSTEKLALSLISVYLYPQAIVWAECDDKFKDRWYNLALHVESLILEARLDECKTHLYDSSMSHIRRSELQWQLNEMRK